MGTSYGQQAEEDMWEGVVSGDRSPVPDDLGQPVAGGVPLATPPQVNYLNDLRAKKDLSSLSRDQVQWLAEVDFSRIPKSRASDVIEKLKYLPRRQNQPQSTKVVNWANIPAGRYAVENNEGELRFYQVWRPRGEDHDKVVKLYVLHGPDSSPVQRNAYNSILGKIGMDVRAAAIRFGMEIGSCSNCGRRLTNRISRELGIGPVCGGRMFGDEFRSMVASKRDEIITRGEDPDEELE
jgi:hypothetical protein